jgi:hypothetical protein
MDILKAYGSKCQEIIVRLATDPKKRKKEHRHSIIHFTATRKINSYRNW